MNSAQTTSPQDNSDIPVLDDVAPKAIDSQLFDELDIPILTNTTETETLSNKS